MYDADFLARLEAALRPALPQWGLAADAPLALLTVSENATFKAAGPAGDLVLRVHRPGYHSRAEIASELAWIEALRAEAVVETPRPIPLLAGGLIADIDDAGVARHAVAFDFVSGAEPEPSLGLVPWFRELGAVHARLHAHARAWQRPAPFVRKVWNWDSMLGARPLWGDYRAALGLDTTGRALLERTAAALRYRMAELGEGPARFGLVHADLRLANLLVKGDRLSLIDFDDCGFSWYLYDFAAAISFIEHEPYVDDLRHAWIEGYRGQAPLPESDAAFLPDLVMLRRVLLTAWIASHAETPTAQDLGVPYTHGTLALAEAYLSRHG